MRLEHWEQVKDLCQSALAVEKEKRDAYLTEVCGGDESLRKEVEALLANEAAARDFLKDPAMEVAARALAGDRKIGSKPDLLGRSLRHYWITEKLGEGGMGVVYRAEDTYTRRHVAIKVLPEEFTDDPERLARFQREAQVLASISHSNIATLYGLEESDGNRFIVMELVEGQTLAHRLLKGPLPMDEALEVCRGIAEGLEAAHEKGIIHRDLKPANVMLTADDKVKILDFGLAKPLAGESQNGDTAHSPTITEAMTRSGVILGTAAYMSPEQARGKPVDKRADIWAFGCVLYECLTGKRAFNGESTTEVMAKILEAEPDWSQLPANTPAFLRSLLRRCIQKDPTLRLHDIADARVEMREGISEPAETIPVAQRFSLLWLLSIGAALLVLGLLSGMVVMKYFRPAVSPISQAVVRSPVKLEVGHWLDGWRRSPPDGLDQPTRTAMALSKDGRFMVYSAIEENPGAQDKPRLYTRRLDQIEANPIVGTESGISPFLSPDDRWVGFWADGKLMKVSVDGGVPAVLCDVPWPFGFSWGTDNQIVFPLNEDTGLSRVFAEGGKPETLTIPDKSKGEYSHRLPHWIPAGKGILFTIMGSGWDMNPRIAVLEPSNRKWRVLLEGASDARYIPTGHLAFLRQGTLMVVPFDLDRLALTGDPIPVVANVMQALNIRDSSWNTAAGQFSISAAGSMTYAPGRILPDMETSLVWVDHKGKAEPIASFKTPFSAPRLSPDGQRIAYQTSGKEGQVWIYDLIRHTATKLNSEGEVTWVTWTADGRRVVFGWSKAGPSNIFWQPADGSSPMERLTISEYYQYPGSWSSHGETLALVQYRPDSGRDILLLQMRDRRVTPFLNSRFDEMYPEPSPDGRWIAYASDESGRSEVYVRQFPRSGGKWQVSGEGGKEPLWSRNGKQLFYHQGNKRWVVDIQTGSGFSASKPRLLFETPGYAGGEPIRGWDISVDGQKFLMVKLEERKPRPVTELILVQNWFEELKRLVPAK